MTKKITKEAAARIQSRADKTGENKEFAERAQSAADRHENEAKEANGEDD